MGDLRNAGWVILVAGVGGGTVVTLFWIVLLKYCVALLTYLTLLMAGICLTLSALILLYKGGQFASVDIASSVTEAAGDSTLFVVAEADDQWKWNICGWVLAILAVVFVVSCCCAFNKIRKATAVIKEAS